MSEERDQNDGTPWVQVVVLGGDIQKLDYERGMTARQVLQAAELEPEGGQVVQVNGRTVDDLDTVIDPNSVVQVTSRVKNG